mmetsp:Transcript_48872/g.87110  ORF Transcript_48872/g.87110 Transcript_48872/m.87110 type:complete len:315 (+) Transcript_48872:1901-2845(+)
MLWDTNAKSHKAHKPQANWSPRAADTWLLPAYNILKAWAHSLEVCRGEAQYSQTRTNIGQPYGTAQEGEGGVDGLALLQLLLKWAGVNNQGLLLNKTRPPDLCNNPIYADPWSPPFLAWPNAYLSSIHPPKCGSTLPLSWLSRCVCLCSSHAILQLVVLPNNHAIGVRALAIDLAVASRFDCGRDPRHSISFTSCGGVHPKTVPIICGGEENVGSLVHFRGCLQNPLTELVVCAEVHTHKHHLLLGLLGLSSLLLGGLNELCLGLLLQLLGILILPLDQGLHILLDGSLVHCANGGRLQLLLELLQVASQLAVR